MVGARGGRTSRLLCKHCADYPEKRIEDILNVAVLSRRIEDFERSLLGLPRSLPVPADFAALRESVDTIGGREVEGNASLDRRNSGPILGTRTSGFWKRVIVGCTFLERIVRTHLPPTRPGARTRISRGRDCRPSPASPPPTNPVGGSDYRQTLMDSKAMGHFILKVADALGLDHPHIVGPQSGRPQCCLPPPPTRTDSAALLSAVAEPRYRSMSPAFSRIGSKHPT
jgi:hypothetical protein